MNTILLVLLGLLIGVCPNLRNSLLYGDGILFCLENECVKNARVNAEDQKTQ